MARIDRHRLENAVFPEQYEFPLRFDDVDTHGHITTGAVATLFQEARRRFNMKRAATLLDAKWGVVVGSLHIDFVDRMHYPTSVEVGTGILEIGRSSFVLGQIGRQAGRVAALAEVTLVATEFERPAPLPDHVRMALDQALIRF